MNIDNVKEGVDLIQQGMSKLSHGPLDYYLRTLVACYDFLLTLAPYQPGDRIRLTKTPEISEKERWGWYGARHFLKAGVTGQIVDVAADGGGFSYGIVFDGETWVESFTGRVHAYPPEGRHKYGFTADWFEHLSETVTELPK